MGGPSQAVAAQVEFEVNLKQGLRTHTASKTRSPTTLDQTKLARDGGGGIDGGGSGSVGRQFRLTHHRRMVPPLGSARYMSSRRRLAAFTASSHAESFDAFCLFRSKSAETR